MKPKRNFGLQRDWHDSRDYQYCTRPQMVELLPTVDMESKCPPIWAQSILGSCVGQGTAAAHQFEQMKVAPEKAFTPSKLFIYYNARKIEGSINEDSGCQIRDALKSISQSGPGVCPEDMWPYLTEKFAREPDEDCYAEAVNHQTIAYHRLNQTPNELKSCLAQGHPIIFGAAIYESFESGQVAVTGQIPMPKHGEEKLGLHCMVLVGYDEEKKKYKLRNSWGYAWGLGGYAWIPYEFVHDPHLAFDCWTITLVETV